MAGEQPKRAPAFVDMRGRGVFKAADIMAPEAEAGKANGEAAAQAFRHRFIVGVTVAAPVHRELLRANGRRAGKQHRFFFTHSLFQHVPDQFVINERIMVVHFLRISAVMPHHIGGNALAEIGFKAVNAHPDQAFQVACVPGTRRRVGEINNPLPWLPFIPLPHRAVRAFQQIALFHTFAEQR